MKKLNEEEIRLLYENKFIINSLKIHNNKYDYSKVKYIKAKAKVCIICPEHGEFQQTPSGHLSGYGCTKCYNERRGANLRDDLTTFISKAQQLLSRISFGKKLSSIT